MQISIFHKGEGCRSKTTESAIKQNLSLNCTVQSHTTLMNLLKQIKFLLLLCLFTNLKMSKLFLSIKNMKKQKHLREMKTKLDA